MDIGTLVGIGVLTLFFVLAGISGVMCPKCYALFVKEEIFRTSIPKKSFLSIQKVRVSYRCKRCGHGWHADWPEDDGYYQ